MMMVRLRALDGSWRCDSRMPKNTLIGGVGKKLWGFGALPRNNTHLYECCGEEQHTPRSDARES